MSFGKIGKIASSAMEHVTRTNREHKRMVKAIVESAADASENVSMTRECAIYTARVAKAGLLEIPKIVVVTLIGYMTLQVSFVGKKEKAEEADRKELFEMTDETLAIVTRNQRHIKYFGSHFRALTLDLKEVRENMKKCDKIESFGSHLQALTLDFKEVREKMKKCDKIESFGSHLEALTLDLKEVRENMKKCDKS